MKSFGWFVAKFCPEVKTTTRCQGFELEGLIAKRDE
jgi:hypothetical protein